MKGFDFVDIQIRIDKQELYINDKTYIHIDIANKSNIRVENVLLRVLLDERVFSIDDSQLKLCVNDFGSIGNIEPNKLINLKIPVIVKSIPKSWVTGISASLNFHIIKNDNLIDLNTSSEEILADFSEINLINNKNFTLKPLKNSYLLDENIDYEVFIKNSGKSPISNLVISDFLPQNCKLINNSIFSSLASKTVLNKDKFFIKELNVNEEVYLNFSIYLENECTTELIQNNANLKYTDKSGKILEVNSDLSNVQINNKNIFSDNEFVYKIEQSKAKINDIIDHTVKIKNNSEIITKNIYIQGDLIDELEFVPNSLVVNSIHRIDESITDNVILGELEPYEEFVISYKTKVLNFFDEKELNLNLSYNTLKRSISQESNKQSIKVMTSALSSKNFIKYINKENYSIGEIVEFTIEVLNEGNTASNNVLLKDSLSKNLEYIEESTFIDNFKVSENIMDTGIIIPNINPNQKVTVKYKARAIKVNKSESSCATLTFKSDKGDENEIIYSNDVKVKILASKIGDNNFIKEMSTDTTQVGDIITVRLFIENQGTIDCETLKIYEPINNSLEFVEGSLRINKVEKLDENIFNGIILDKLKENESLSITYQLKVLDFPKPNPIDDRAVLNYTCVYNDKIETKTVYSTRCKLYVNNPDLEVIDNNSFFANNGINKYCHYKDYVFYNLTLTNKGNVGLENVSLNFNFPKDLIIDYETLKINNAPYNKNIENNLSLPNLNISQSMNIEFYAKHEFLSNYNIESFINFSYTFRDLRSKEIFKKSKKVKENIIIINPNLEINKFISDKDIEINKEFTKNIHIKNTGNVELENLILDLNENDFLRNSNKTVFVNGNYYELNDNLVIDYLNINENVNISIRYNIDEMPLFDTIINESEVVATYQFNKEYSPVQIRRKSNKIELDIKSCFLDIRGKCSSKTLVLDEVYTYVFKVSNVGNVKCDSLNFIGEIPGHIDYIENTLKVNNRKINAKKLNTRINLGELNLNETINITFDFVVNSLPFNKTVNINSVIEAKYFVGEEGVRKKFKSQENLLNIENIDIDIIKTTSEEVLQNGDSAIIQTIINNVGSVDVYNLVLKDNDEKNFRFVDDSVYIDGENIPELNPTEGIEISKLPAGKNLLISYEYDYLPKLHVSKLLHYSDLEYNYNLGFGKEKTITIQSNMLYIEGCLSTFKQFNVENEYTLKDYEPDLGEIVSITSNAVIDDYYEINSIKNRSLDNSNSTGKKVIIKGNIMNRIEYFTGDGNNSLYMLEISQPYTAFINLPSDYNFEDLYFKAKCDDTFYKSIDSRGIFISSLISISGLM